MENIKQIMMQFKERLEVLEKRMTNLEGQVSSRQESLGKLKQPSKNLSLREFIAEKNPVDDVQRTLVIGYYLEHNKGMDSFNAEDIKKEFMSAKLKPPVNINDKINLNIRKGLMMELEKEKGSRKSWTLTDTGEKQIENGFKKEDR